MLDGTLTFGRPRRAGTAISRVIHAEAVHSGPSIDEFAVRVREIRALGLRTCPDRRTAQAPG